MGKRGKIARNRLTVSDCAPSPADKSQERRYKAEDALRVLQRAKEYQTDKNLMKDVKELAREQMNALKRI